MAIKLNFKQEGDIKSVSYLTPRNTFGYISLFVTYLVMVGIIYLFLSQNLKTIPLYFHIILILLLGLSYIPQKITLMWNNADKVLSAKLIGVGGFSKRRYTLDFLKNTERQPKILPKLLKMSFVYTSKMLSQEQTEEIAKYFGISSNWLRNSVGTEPEFGIHLSE